LPKKICYPPLVRRALAYDPFRRIGLDAHPLMLTSREFDLTAYASFKTPRLKTTRCRWFHSQILSPQNWQINWPEIQQFMPSRYKYLGS
jgi:hypothetical protein